MSYSISVFLFCLSLFHFSSYALVSSEEISSEENSIYALVGKKREPAKLMRFNASEDFRLAQTIDLNHKGVPRGIVAHKESGKMYFTVEGKLFCFDLISKQILWTRDTLSLAKEELGEDTGYRLQYLIGDRLDLSIDGKRAYLPAGFWSKDPHLYVVDLEKIHHSRQSSGFLSTVELVKMIRLQPHGHNTVMSLTGDRIYLSSVKSSYIDVIDTFTLQPVDRVGPFQSYVRPYIVSQDQLKIFANLDHLLGFAVFDKTLGFARTYEVEGFPSLSPVSHAPTPSHGIALSPKGAEVWVVDNPGGWVHVFSKSLSGFYIQDQSIKLNGHPGWLQFNIAGDLVFSSTGDVIEARGDFKDRLIVGTLKDDSGLQIESEKILDVQIKDGNVTAVGNQYSTDRDSLAPSI